MHLALGNQWALIGMPMAQVKTIKREEKCLTTSTLLLTQWRRERGSGEKGERGEQRRWDYSWESGSGEKRKAEKPNVDRGKWVRKRDAWSQWNGWRWRKIEDENRRVIIQQRRKDRNVDGRSEGRNYLTQIMNECRWEDSIMDGGQPKWTITQL